MTKEEKRQMEEEFNEEICIDTLRFMSGDRNLKEMPHYDTLNYYLERLSPQCLSDLRRKMIVSLIRGKQFYGNRLLGKYWKVILNGTGVSYFSEKHCENCLREERTLKDGRKSALYATEPMMKICRLNGWRHIFVHKDSKQRVLAENYKLLTKEDGKQEVKGIGDERGDGTFYNHVGILSDKTEEMNVFEYNCVKMEKGKEKKVHFQWITDIEFMATEPKLDSMPEKWKPYCPSALEPEDMHLWSCGTTTVNAK